MDSDALITVIVPVHNAARFVRWTVASIRNQSYRNFDCLLIDDGSSDASLRILIDMLGDDDRFRVLKHAKNQGAAAARNTGLRATRTPYVCFLDADDLMHPQSLELRLKGLAAADKLSCVGVYCATGIVGPNDHLSPQQATHFELPYVNFLSAAGACPFTVNQPLFLTKAARRIGGFNENLSQAEDYDFWLRLLREGYAFAPIAQALVYYRRHAGSHIRSNPLEHLSESRRLYDTCFKQQISKSASACTPWAAYKSVSEYQRQLGIANRTLEFSGMAIEAGAQIGDVIQTAFDLLPDLFGQLEPFVDIEGMLAEGMRRQNPALDVLPQHAANRISEFSTEFKALSLRSENQRTPVASTECESGYS